MAENSKIEWTDHTVNLWWGCAKVHTGCKNCYAEHLSETRYKNGVWGEKAKRKRIKSAFKDLDKYQRNAAKRGVKERVFVGSMMDIFEDSKELNNPTDQHRTTGELRQELFKRITNYEYENLIFLFLTKRPRNVWQMIPEEWSHGWHNVWFGTSVSNEETTIYARQLANSLTYQNLFLSVEPQVGPIDGDDLPLADIGWLIQGGESGNKRRPFNIEWAYDLMGICNSFDVPYFFKQIDKVQPVPEDLKITQLPVF